MRLILVLTYFLLLSHVNAQTITTYAGTGGTGNTGDSGLATNATISYPVGGIFDEQGVYYFTTGNTGNSVRKITPDGIITKIAGTGTQGYSGDGGQAILAKLKNPQHVILDSLGNLFIADAGNNCIRKIEISTGIITTIAGTGTAGFSGDGALATQAQLYDPLDICFDKIGNLYIADHVNCRIRKVSVNGIITTICGNGISGNTGDGGLAINAQVSPFGICSDDTGNVYIANAYNVRKITPGGMIFNIAGNGLGGSAGDGGLAINAEVTPWKIVFDNNTGNIFIAGNTDNKVRKVDVSGIINTVAGTGALGYSGDGGDPLLATFHGTFGIALDLCGNLYISDGNNRRIRKVTYNDTCTQTSASTTLSKKHEFSLYPNPAKESIIITGNNLQSITITNTLGQVMHWQKVSKEKSIIDISYLSAGVYFVKVSDKHGQSLTKKIVKQ